MSDPRHLNPRRLHGLLQDGFILAFPLSICKQNQTKHCSSMLKLLLQFGSFWRSVLGPKDKHTGKTFHGFPQSLQEMLMRQYLKMNHNCFLLHPKCNNIYQGKFYDRSSLCYTHQTTSKSIIKSSHLYKST
jgi:hypothetical protein